MLIENGRLCGDLLCVAVCGAGIITKKELFKGGLGGVSERSRRRPDPTVNGRRLRSREKYPNPTRRNKLANDKRGESEAVDESSKV
eukprot:6192416-Pleurochrysis_carterae.AAC.1